MYVIVPVRRFSSFDAALIWAQSHLFGCEYSIEYRPDSGQESEMCLSQDTEA